MTTPQALTTIGAALRYTGRDVLPVLHRISSNALEDLAPGEARATLFLDFRGRLLHRAAVARAADDTIWLVRADAASEELAAHVDRHVFREDVQVATTALTGISVRYESPRPRGVFEEKDGQPTRLTLPTGETFEWTTAPFDNRARIAAGIPRHGFEVRDSFNPFEIGLAAEVHLSKGCYTGQEVLQRLITYGSVRRRLARLSGAGAPPMPGTTVLVANEPVGVVTSGASDGAGFIALAVVKRDASPGAAIVEGNDADARFEFLPEQAPQGRS